MQHSKLNRNFTRREKELQQELTITHNLPIRQTCNRTLRQTIGEQLTLTFNVRACVRWLVGGVRVCVCVKECVRTWMGVRYRVRGEREREKAITTEAVTAVTQSNDS